MPGPSLPLALAAAVAVTIGALSSAPAAPPAEPAPTASHRPAAHPPGPGEVARAGAGLPGGAAAAVEPPVVPAAAAPLTAPRVVMRPASGPSAAPSSGPASRSGWRWPLAPAPTVVHRFAVGPFRWSPGHRGADLLPAGGAGPGGSPVVVLAAGAGVVRFAGVVAGRGVVTVDHGGGLRTTYEPVSATVTAGVRVAAGTPLGTLQPAGHCAPRSCLHWGAVADGTYLDPLSLLRPRDPPVLLPVP